MSYVGLRFEWWFEKKTLRGFYEWLLNAEEVEQ